MFYKRVKYRIKNAVNQQLLNNIKYIPICFCFFVQDKYHINRHPRVFFFFFFLFKGPQPERGLPRKGLWFRARDLKDGGSRTLKWFDAESAKTLIRREK